jgi:hypothetical protein
MTIMRMRNLFCLLNALVLCALCTSCGPGDGESAAADAGFTTDAEVNLATRPCNIHATYQGKPLGGDGQCIEAPPPDKGFQFHYGPANYDDPNEIARYILMPGKEVTDCVFFKTNNATDLYFNEYHSRLRPGSHHMLLYIQNQQVPEGVPSACNQTLSRNLFGATSPTMDASVNMSNAPEDEGLAVRIPPKQQVVMQMHVINVGTAPILREGWANIMYTDKAHAKIIGDPIYFLGGLSMSIPVGQTVLNHGTATVPANADPNFRLLLAIPHYHAHTTRFTAYKTINGVKEVLLEEYGKLGVPTDPQLIAFDSRTKNPAPDRTTQTPGAFSGDVYMKPGDTIDWECEQTNDGIGIEGQKFTTPLQFTEQVYNGEMCNLFGMYAPSTDPTGDGTWQSVLNP